MEDMMKEKPASPQTFRRIKILFPRSAWIVIFFVVGLPLAALTVGTVIMLIDDPEPWPMLVILLILDFLIGLPLRTFVVGKVVITPEYVMEQKIWDKKIVRRSDVAKTVFDSSAPRPTLRLLDGEGRALLELDTALYAWPRELAQALKAEQPG